MIKTELADATSDRESVKGRAAASRFKPWKAGQIHGVAGQERRHRTQANMQSITSDNICHIKSNGVGADWVEISYLLLRRKGHFLAANY